MFVSCVVSGGEPLENDAVRAIAERIEKRLHDGGDHSVYSGVYLIWARGTADEVREALAAGAEPNAWEPQRPARENPLHTRTMPPLAIAVGTNPDPETIRALLTGGADPNQDNSAGATALHMATANANAERIEILLKAGAGVDTVDEEGANAFHYLLAHAWWRDPSRLEEALAVLLDAGLDPNAEMNNDATPLHHFAEFAEVDDSETAAGLLPALRVFVDGGADVHRRVGEGYEPIWGLTVRRRNFRKTSADFPPPSAATACGPRLRYQLPKRQGGHHHDALRRILQREQRPQG